MQDRELIRQFQALDSLFQKIPIACGGDIEMMSHWAKYLCVLSAGFIENALKEIYGSFIKGAASEPVAQFANSALFRIQNPKTYIFIKTAKAFKKPWAEKLETFVDEDGRREAIDSIMQNRHHISHGKDSGITIARLRPYLNKAVEVLDFVEVQCNS